MNESDIMSCITPTTLYPIESPQFFTHEGISISSPGLAILSLFPPAESKRANEFRRTKGAPLKLTLMTFMQGLMFRPVTVMITESPGFSNVGHAEHNSSFVVEVSCFDIMQTSAFSTGTVLY